LLRWIEAPNRVHLYGPNTSLTELRPVGLLESRRGADS
jgi:hypothetical protein